MFRQGDKVEISFNKASLWEMANKKNAAYYQTQAETGEIISFHMENDTRFQGGGPSYLVDVDRGDGGRKRKRIIPASKLKKI